jgi:redox-sensitive bicupin YhaK (pirin superfamily)
VGDGLIDVGWAAVAAPVGLVGLVDDHLSQVEGHRCATGRGTIGVEQRPFVDGQLAVFGDGGHLVVTAARTSSLDFLLVGGLPVRAPIAHYGPFVMNTREEILRAIEDYQAGRLGVVPAEERVPRPFR